jgi:hypothetical protein
MSGIFAKTFHPFCALVGFVIVTALVFGGLLSSGFTMFAVVAIPQCMTGTRTEPYPTTIVAPNAQSKPFCTSDALNNGYQTTFQSHGYLGVSSGFTSSFTSSSAMTSLTYCFKRSNGTCPTFGDEGANTFIVGFNGATGSRFVTKDPKQFPNAVPAQSVLNYNNIPITLGPSSALPAGVDASKTYFIRGLVTAGLGAGSFRIAADTKELPLDISGTSAGDITVTVPSFSSCPTQQNVKMPAIPNQDSNTNADGTYKVGTCGYCLSQRQFTGWLAVPVLCGFTIALLLILEILMCIPAARKLAFFRILFVIISVICIIFLIAAVGAGGTMFYETAKCFSQTDFSEAQYSPAPTANAFDGFTPSAGGAPMIQTLGLGRYLATQASGAAAYMKPYLVPSIGAAHLIAAIVLLFVFTIIFAIKTDWADVASSGDAGLTPK